MKSRLPLFLAILCAILAAPPCHAQNTTPADANNPPSNQKPGSIHIQLGPNGNPQADIPYHEGMTLLQFMKSLPKELNRADPTGVYLAHTSQSGTLQPGTLIDCTTIESGQAKDIPLSPGDWISTRFRPFVFPGGNPRDFVRDVQDYYGVDWSMAVIPPEMANVQIPNFGIKSGTDVNEAMDLYNELSTRTPSLGLGQWYNRGPLTSPEVLMLVPDKSATPTANPAPQAKALAIADIPKNQWDTISHDIEKADIASQEFAGSHEPHPSGQLLFQDDSKILVVIGPPSFIELAESVVAAYRENARIADLEAAGYKPSENPPPSPPQ